jgi:hypothetical protein
MTARDPQRTTGSTAGYVMRPPCQCEHPVVFHVLIRGPRRLRGRCNVGGPDGPCGCAAYRPAETAEVP